MQRHAHTAQMHLGTLIQNAGSLLGASEEQAGGPRSNERSWTQGPGQPQLGLFSKSTLRCSLSPSCVRALRQLMPAPIQHAMHVYRSARVPTGVPAATKRIQTPCTQCCPGLQAQTPAARGSPMEDRHPVQDIRPPFLRRNRDDAPSTTFSFTTTLGYHPRKPKRSHMSSRGAGGGPLCTPPFG